MKVFSNITGTTASVFRIGKRGVTILQGTADPNMTVLEASNGDIYVRNGASQKLYQFRGSVWVPLNTEQEFCRKAVTTASYAATDLDYYLGVNRSGPVDIYLPTGTADKKFIIKDESGAAGTNAITIHAHPGNTIDGATTVPIDTDYSAVTVVYGAEWHII